MKAFADLLEKLILTPSRNRKIEAMINYLKQTPDPDRGFAIAAITRDLKLRTVQPSLMRQLIADQMDEELFRLSYDYVGDLAETVALLWKGSPLDPMPPPSLGSVVELLQKTSRSDAPSAMRQLLDQSDPSSRYALIKMATGGLRIGVSSRLAKQALAAFGKVQIEEIEELWHGLTPPFHDLFDWLEGRGEKPVSKAYAPFRPVMLSNALEERERDVVTPEDFIAEWKWDGIRVQLAHDRGVKRLYSRTGDDISVAFPDLIEAIDFEGTFDGELLVRSPMDEALNIRPFSDLQQRLNRKTVSKPMLVNYPAFAMLYDILFDGLTDCRDMPLLQRKNRLEHLISNADQHRFALSSVLPFETFEDLAATRQNPSSAVIEGLMLKRKDSKYLAGRPRGPWYKWKQDPKTVDAVLLYAQRGHGKRSGYYSDFTFGCWRKTPDGNRELVPVGKAYFGFTDEELKQLDKHVRENTFERFGPVRSVVANEHQGLVFEVAFEGINRSPRHKSGVAMRFPRISRIRWDKPTSEADELAILEAMIGSEL